MGKVSFNLRIYLCIIQNISCQNENKHFGTTAKRYLAHLIWTSVFIYLDGRKNHADNYAGRLGSVRKRKKNCSATLHIIQIIVELSAGQIGGRLACDVISHSRIGLHKCNQIMFYARSPAILISHVPCEFHAYFSYVLTANITRLYKLTVFPNRKKCMPVQNRVSLRIAIMQIL